MTEATPQIPDIDVVSAAFGSVDHLPAWNDLPAEFRDHWHRDGGWCDLVSKWFFNGLDKDAEGLIIKPGLDEDKAWAALNAILRSWAPKHEHKIAGVGYLMSQWFDQETK